MSHVNRLAPGRIVIIEYTTLVRGLCALRGSTSVASWLKLSTCSKVLLGRVDGDTHRFGSYARTGLKRLRSPLK